jgi:hypothetical protein
MCYVLNRWSFYDMVKRIWIKNLTDLRFGL